jgi:hypothetical protein
VVKKVSWVWDTRSRGKGDAYGFGEKASGTPYYVYFPCVFFIGLSNSIPVGFRNTRNSYEDVRKRCGAYFCVCGWDGQSEPPGMNYKNSSGEYMRAYALIILPKSYGVTHRIEGGKE